jgi:hypothetical protein
MSAGEIEQGDRMSRALLFDLYRIGEIRRVVLGLVGRKRVLLQALELLREQRGAAESNENEEMSSKSARQNKTGKRECRPSLGQPTLPAVPAESARQKRTGKREWRPSLGQPTLPAVPASGTRTGHRRSFQRCGFRL